MVTGDKIYKDIKGIANELVIEVPKTRISKVTHMWYLIVVIMVIQRKLYLTSTVPIRAVVTMRNWSLLLFFSWGQ